MNVGSKVSIKNEIITQLDNLGCKIDEKGVNCNVFQKKVKLKSQSKLLAGRDQISCSTKDNSNEPIAITVTTTTNQSINEAYRSSHKSLCETA